MNVSAGSRGPREHCCPLASRDILVVGRAHRHSRVDDLAQQLAVGATNLRSMFSPVDLELGLGGIRFPVKTQGGDRQVYGVMAADERALALVMRTGQLQGQRWPTLKRPFYR